MSKDSYFEMCEMLGQEPVDEDMPVELEDFPELVQQTFTIYSLLSDTWDNMGGGYLGKDYANLFNLLSVFDIEKTEALLVLDLLKYMDSIRGSIISEKIKARSPGTK